MRIRFAPRTSGGDSTGDLASSESVRGGAEAQQRLEGGNDPLFAHAYTDLRTLSLVRAVLKLSSRGWRGVTMDT